MNGKISELYKKSYLFRKRFLEIFSELGYGHLTTAFSETEILIAIMEEIMQFEGDDHSRDRLVMSKGHGAGMLFPILEDMGVLSKEEISSIVKVGGDYSKLKGLYYPGFVFYGGSLGLGLGMAAGMALGAKLSHENWLTFCILGDAECYEGSIWEAMLFASHNNLNNLIVVIDRNYLGCSDFTENMCALEPLEEKWRACNWNTKRINGHSYEEILDTLEGVRSRRSSRPLCIIAETIKGKGVEQLSNIPLMHGYMPQKDSVSSVLNSLEKMTLIGEKIK